MSSSASSNEHTPQFTEGNPTGDLSGHRNYIAYALGEINANIKHLTKSLRERSGDLDRLKETTEAGLKEVKDSIKRVEDKILVAETRVSSAVFTSKWFFAFVAAVVGWIIGNWSIIERVLHVQR